ncbi:MAG: hypothetical protein AAF985_00025 [Bacteroidota bacterium]
MAASSKNKTFALRGTARFERLQRALLPDYALIDERRLSDLLSFAADYAQVINFYDTNNKVVGDWSAFFKKDVSVFLADIITLDLDELRNNIQETINRIYQSPEGDSNQKYLLFRSFFYQVLEWARLVNDLYIRSFQLRKIAEETPIERELEMSIQRNLRDALKALKSYDLGTALEEKFSMPLGGNYEEFHPIWDLSRVEAFNVFIGKDLDEKVEHATKSLQLIFRKFDFGLTNVIKNAPELLRQSLRHKNDHQPDIALFIAFLQLYRFNQNHLNSFTEKHLDYYYRTVLQQKECKRSPDHAHVVVELGEHLDRYTLEKGTRLLAEVNANGLESHYQTDAALEISKAKIESLKTVFVSKPVFAGVASSYRLVGNIYAAPVANSKDGMGTPFDAEDFTWPTFGEEQSIQAKTDKKMMPADIGMMIASPVLMMAEGQREIRLQFQFKMETLNTLRILLDNASEREKLSVDHVFLKVFREALDIQLSGATAWVAVDKYEFNVPSAWQNGCLELKLSLAHSQPAIVPYDATVLGKNIDTQWPILKIRLKNEGNVYAYSFLKKLELEKIDIEVAVKGMKDVAIYNNLGLIDNSAPFQPFGLTPTKNAYFLIGSPELFNKELTDFSVKIDWDNLPEEGFAKYYEAYHSGIDDQSFKVQLSALSNYEFYPLEEEIRQGFDLFQSEGSEGTLSEQTQLDAVDLEKLKIAPDYELLEIPEFTNRSRIGFFKIQLKTPTMGFGFKAYPILFAKALAENAKAENFRFFQLKKKPPALVPREPFVPVINKLTIDYKAKSSLDIANTQQGGRGKHAKEKLFHIHPFEIETIFENGFARSAHLLPQYDEEGYLYIGLSNLRPLEKLSLLFRLETSKETYNKKPVEITWMYLAKDIWKAIEEENILFNTTENFTKTGIVNLNIPVDITKGNQQLDDHLYWLRVSVKGNKDVLGRAKNILAHAVRVTWVDNGDTDHFKALEQLPRIKELVQSLSAIKKVEQPDAFFGGRPKEEKADFYLRVSERLRHKNRGINRWDIERLVLERFPYIHQVKCFGNAGNEAYVEPGIIKVVVVPKVNEKWLMPKVGFDRLIEIKKYLTPIVAPIAEIDVINPVYEKIVINCDIKFDENLKGKGLTFYQLHEEIKHRICPWLQGKSLAMGGSLLQNELLNFIKDRPYVKFVTAFSILHITEKEGYFTLTDSARSQQNSSTIQASMPWSVLVPVEKHQINLISKEVFKSSEITLINKMRLGTEFIISANGKEPLEMEWLVEQPEEEEDQSFWIVNI